jgi:hypothetical protein
MLTLHKTGVYHRDSHNSQGEYEICHTNFTLTKLKYVTWKNFQSRKEYRVIEKLKFQRFFYYALLFLVGISYHMADVTKLTRKITLIFFLYSNNRVPKFMLLDSAKQSLKPGFTPSHTSAHPPNPAHWSMYNFQPQNFLAPVSNPFQFILFIWPLGLLLALISLVYV